MCMHHACRNNAECIPINSERRYVCHCKPGFYGLYCEHGWYTYKPYYDLDKQNTI